MMRSLSLVARVTLASALAGALGGSAAALTGGFSAHGLVTKQEKKNVRAAARELAEDIKEELYGDEDHDSDEDDDQDERDAQRAQPPLPHEGSVGAVLARELRGVKLPGARAVVRTGSNIVAGDPALPPVERGECELLPVQGQLLRLCTVPLRSQLLTLAASAEAERERSSLIWSAVLLGLCAGALLGGGVSYGLSRWALAPLTQLGARVRGLRVDAVDISGLGPPAPQAEVEELRAAIAALVARSATALLQARSFAQEAAHELRTPLATLAGELELLVEGELPDKTSLQRAHAQVTQLSTLVQRLLVLAQAQPLAAEATEVVDLADIVSAACEAIEPERRARIEAQCGDDVIVGGDAALLTSLVINALDNALKFSTGSVSIRSTREAQLARIEVQDRGPGVAPAERERVFEPFYRSASVRAAGSAGHGIGLAVIARVAWLHHGHAEFVAQDSGALLRVSLPLWAARDASSGAASSLDSRSAPPPASS